MAANSEDVALRDVVDADLDIFFTQEQDPDAIWMAAFTPKDPSDRAAFDQHWAKIRADPTIINQTIMVGFQVAGSMGGYEEEPGKPEVTYWLGKEFWGQGVASHALNLFLTQLLTARPVYARVAQDNLGSRRVLEKNGFVIIGEDSGYANARHAETAEYLLRRDE